jgi:valyl-tRNA synthetase
VFQLIVTEIRNLRADQKLDKKQALVARLYCGQDVLAVAEREKAVIERLGNVTLHIESGRVPQLGGAVRSNTEFDLVFELPEVDRSGQSARLVREIKQLDELITRTDKQFANEKFMNGAPAHVVESMRRKRAEYAAELEKKREALASIQ